MLSCYLQGGIGNQLFQISTTLSLAKDIGVECSFPFDQHFLPLQGTKADKYINNVFSKLKRLPHSYYNKLKIINETNFSYKKLPIEDNIFLRGYFQSEKYFKHNEEYIKEIFSFDNNNKKILNKYSHLFKGETCSIHIRRGDYLKFPNEHPILPIEYYNKSMNMFGKNTNFIVFSDDMDWVKKNIKGENIIYIQQNVDYIDLYLMISIPECFYLI